MVSENLNHRKYEIDWQRFPSVVFESDDWGACESATEIVAAAKVSALHKQLVNRDRSTITTLETPAQLERLFQMLEKYKGIDGLPAVFTAFVCTGNPDFERIRANGYTKYEDIGLDTGVPDGWERGDIAGKLREGFERGIFHPEFHSTLHHTSPYLWLKRLRGNSDKGKLSRALFDLKCYCQGEHLPEFHDMNVRQQNEWVKTGITRFKNIFGFAPSAAVTSDAFPETETIWSINGIKTVCLKNCRSNKGETIVYTTKPWNMQDIYAKIGDYNEIKDVVYMTRNAFFESGMAPGWNDSADDVLRVAKQNIKEFNEPTIISTHRINYVSLDEEMIEKRYSELEKLLQGLSQMKMNFLTTVEVSQLYRQGWSARKSGDKTILRKWHEDARITDIAVPKSIITLENQQAVESTNLSELPLGSYLLGNE
jgi:hypothetical protein